MHRSGLPGHFKSKAFEVFGFLDGGKIGWSGDGEQMATRRKTRRASKAACMMTSSNSAVSTWWEQQNVRGPRQAGAISGRANGFPCSRATRPSARGVRVKQGGSRMIGVELGYDFLVGP